jgi:hypothetical protein
MTDEEIIRMAREAATGMPGYYPEIEDPEGDLLEFFVRFIDIAIANEREACAKVVEADPSYDWHRFACEAAAAIRARGQQ